MKLFRPIGMNELRLIYQLQLCAFPPRLPEQPIFYPILNFAYAEQIARDWNTRRSPFAGYVTEFEVEDTYVSQFDRQVVGARMHEELWVPAEQLDEFNNHIQGVIEVTAGYFGTAFQGYIPDKRSLKGRAAADQFVLLAGLYDTNRMDFQREIVDNHQPVFLHILYWSQYDFSQAGISAEQQNEVVMAIEQAWSEIHPNMPLPRARREVA